MENLYHTPQKLAVSLEALLVNGGVAPAGDTSGSMLEDEDLPPMGLCAALSPRHRLHAKAALKVHVFNAPSKVTIKMATAQACLTAAVKAH